jgi:uncharacterized membrane protein YdbT with pleckstrin-like domain
MRTSNIVKKSIGTNEQLKLRFSICFRYLKFKISISLLKWLLIFILAFIVLSVISSNWQFAFGPTTSNQDYFYNNDLSNGSISSPSLDISEDNMETIWLIIIAIYIFIVIPSVLFYNLYYLRIRNEFVFSDKRILVKTGWISTKMISINYNRITDVSITQSLVDRLLNIGSLAISTAGSEGYRVSLSHINKPHNKKKLLHELKESYRKNYQSAGGDEGEDDIE